MQSGCKSGPVESNLPAACLLLWARSGSASPTPEVFGEGFWLRARSLRRTPHSGRPPPARPPARPEPKCGSLPAGSRQGRHRGGDITGTSASNISSAPQSPSQRAHWRLRGSIYQPAPRLQDRASVCMGVTGGSGRAPGGGSSGGRAGKATVSGGGARRGRSGSARGPFPCSQTPGT